MPFRPYLFFGGNCREAFTRYEEVFGGELMLLPMKDVPGETPPPEIAEAIIHAALTMDDGSVLMGSDDPMSQDFGPVQGMMVTVDATDLDDANRLFDALADGGTVTEAIQPTFFSVGFGMCTDRFGTPWMIVGPDPNQPTT